ncbi:hypothetical protein SAMN05660862_2043 [Sphingobacterium psychroaquaticum]|uniref:Uncharacterized protein n=1 Tax=Sphingobacterium psychroaquaticum TaxID=561061 RepID=A0A1X7JR26_9SPHI|nr:hypothetical protein SAMN05660862_2043 [Sphingobacterium psychroaquaticum]
MIYNYLVSFGLRQANAVNDWRYFRNTYIIMNTIIDILCIQTNIFLLFLFPLLVIFQKLYSKNSTQTVVKPI